MVKEPSSECGEERREVDSTASETQVENSNVETAGVEISEVILIEGQPDSANARNDGEEHGVVYLSDVRPGYVPKRVEKPTYLAKLSMLPWSYLFLSAVAGPLIWLPVLITGIAIPLHVAPPFDPIRIALSLFPIQIWSSVSAWRLLCVPQSSSRQLIVERIGLEVGFVNSVLFQIYLLAWYPGTIGFLLSGLALILPALVLTTLKTAVGTRVTVMSMLKVVTGISVFVAMAAYAPASRLLVGVGVIIIGPIPFSVPGVTMIVQCIMCQYSRSEAAEKGIRTPHYWQWMLIALLGSWLVAFGCFLLIQWYLLSSTNDPNVPW